MELKDTLSKFNQIQSVLSRPDMSFLYQRDIEVYMMALELADSNDNLIDYFAFPVMPQSITKTENQIINTRKTMGGVTVLTSDTAPIQSISIKGDFGRSFKITLNSKQPSTQGFAFSINNGIYSNLDAKSNTTKIKFPFLFEGIQTGFGAINTLRAIISKSTGTDKTGNPFRLYMYNMALGESYLVAIKPDGITISQSLDKNMIWSYSLTLDILSPLELVRGGDRISSSIKAVAMAALSKDLNNKLKQLRSIL
jgi:hypothetical protein